MGRRPQAAGRNGTAAAGAVGVATLSSASIRHSCARVQVGQIHVTEPSGSCWLLHPNPATSAAVRGRAQSGQGREGVSMGPEGGGPALRPGEPRVNPTVR